jgi:hypothetical protein
MAGILRRKTPTERLAIAFRLWRFAQQMLQETLRRDQPDCGEVEIVARSREGCLMEPSDLLRRVAEVKLAEAGWTHLG